MQRKISTAALMGALALGFAGTASADEDARIAQLEAQVAQLTAQQQGDWLTEARAQEVRGLVQDVLADADTRATLLQEGMMAGIDNNGKVFLQSADGQFSMNISGQIQVRYNFNFQDNRNKLDPTPYSASGFSVFNSSLEVDEAVVGFDVNGDGDATDTGVALSNLRDSRSASESESGLNVRRAKVTFSGTVADGWEYLIRIAANSNTGNAFFEDVVIGHDLGDGWDFKVGMFKLPFARQELISSTRQVGVERGVATEFFTLNRAEQVNFGYENDQFHFNVALSDGGNSGFTGQGGDNVNDFAITARADVRLDGEWADAKDEFGSDNDALFVGGAVHYEKADGGLFIDEQLVWTIDALWKTGGFGVTAAIFGSHISTEIAGAPDLDQYGAYVQVDYVLDEKWDVFGRWDYINDDTEELVSSRDDSFHAATVGVNYHVNANVKFTTDIIYAISGDGPIGLGAINGGLGGLLAGANDNDEQIAWRAQLQLLF